MEDRVNWKFGKLANCEISFSKFLVADYIGIGWEFHLGHEYHLGVLGGAV